MTHLPEILAALALVYGPPLALWLLWRRWRERDKPRMPGVPNARYLVYGGSIR